MPIQNRFDKNASLALKGIAISLMMLHHNFRDRSLFKNYSISFFPFQEQQVVNIALSCKICVSIFAFISGYGLFLSYQNSNMSSSNWVAKRYIRTFSGFWFVWIASSLISQLIDGRTTRILCSGNLFQSITYIIIDFLGLAKLFGTPSVNGTWWYMSAAAVFILLIPCLYKYKNNLWLILIIPSVFIRIIHNDVNAIFPGGNSVYSFLSPFIFGAIFAHYGYFDKWCSLGNHSVITRIYKIAVELWLLVFLYKMYHNLSMSAFWEFHFGIYPVILIAFCVEYVLPIVPLKNILMFFGKHSMNVFLVHTFIRGYYLANHTYSWKHFAIICLILLIESTAVSIIIEKLISVFRYDLLIDKIIRRFD